MVSFGNHPEVLTGSSLGITSDFTDATRRGVEDGIVYPNQEIPGVGGVCVYVSAAVGGMMSPLRVEVTDGSGQSYRDNTFEKSDALGNVMAELTLQAIAESQTVAEPNLSFAVQEFDVPVENVLFQAAFQSGMLIDPCPTMKMERRSIHIRRQWRPQRSVRWTLGTFGCRQCQSCFRDWRLVDMRIPISPIQISKRLCRTTIPIHQICPRHLKDLISKSEWRQSTIWIIGLGNDELGYFIPSYNYRLSETVPYFNEAEGDHYEETNSLGPSAYPIIETEIHRLLEWMNQ